jgi:cobalt-zinc-cadmium resistance protein CzcA
VVRGIGLLKNIQDIQNILVDNINGVPVYVKTVATVTESALPRLGQVGRGEDNDAVEGIVVMRKGENPSEVIQSLNLKVEELNSKILPNGVKIKTFYNRQTLLDFCIETVTHNLIEGIVLVTLIVLIFLADWRASLIVSMIIPLALLFAFCCLKLLGMNVNLLSLGAVDFGIIIDGTVVVVEGLLWFWLIKQSMWEWSALINWLKCRLSSVQVLAWVKRFLPQNHYFDCFATHFCLPKVEGKMFTPLAWTLGSALLGALIFTLTLVPVMVSILMNKNVREKSNFLVDANEVFDEAFQLLFYA